MSDIAACERSMIYRWWFSSYSSSSFFIASFAFFSSRYPRKKRRKAALCFSLSPCFFSALQRDIFGSLPFVVVAAICGKNRSIISHCQNWKERFWFYSLLFSPFFSLWLFRSCFSVVKKKNRRRERRKQSFLLCSSSLARSLSLSLPLHVNSIIDMKWDRSSKSTRAEAKFDFDC